MFTACCSKVEEAGQAGSAEQTFNRLYAEWRADFEKPEVSYSSNTETYTALRSYRAIVALGRPALPCLQENMQQDWKLVYAAAEIQGWNRFDFQAEYEQDFRDMVLERMKKEPNNGL